MSLPDAVEFRGVAYGYGGDIQPVEYRLGEKPVDGFIDAAHAHFDGLSEDSTVVDLGCGAGRFLRHAPAERPWRYLGIDHDPNAVSQARRLLREGDAAQVGDITNLPRIEADAAVSHRVLHALPEELHEVLMGAAHQILTDGGEFFLSAASVDDWKARKLQADGAFEPAVSNDCSGVMFGDYGISRTEPFSIRFFNLDELMSLAERTGFEVVDTLSFEESSGYEHLQGTQNTYLALQLQKTSGLVPQM